MNVTQKGKIAGPKIGRNDPCPCGSEKKFKQCCEGKDIPEYGLFAGGARTSDLKARLTVLNNAALEHTRHERWAAALTPLLEVARLDPDNAHAHYNVGYVQMRRGVLPSAIASFERTLALKPGRDDALRNLAWSLEHLSGREKEAAALYQKLSRRVSDHKLRLSYAAKALMLEGRREEATELMRRVVALAPNDVDAHVQLAQLLTDRRLFDEAVQEYEKTLEASPMHFRSLTEVRRMREDDRPLIERMRSVAERPELDGASRAAVLFGLGKGLDDLADYAEAMRCYDAANNLRPQWRAYEREAQARQFDALVASFDRAALDRAAQSFERRGPGDKPILIVGMPRSGTTLTEQIISAHPAVVSGGELGFWNQQKLQWGLAVSVVPSPDQLAKAREDYLALLSKLGPGAARVTDKAPLNFMALHLIHITFPEARIVHCRRHPVDTCLSNYFADFGEYHRFTGARQSLVDFYRQYESLMAHWRVVLPPDRFTDVDYERLVEDREAETRRLVAFVGLDWSDACLAPEKNTRVVRTASIWQARQPVYKTSVERWRRYEPWLGELRQLLPDERWNEAAGA